MTYSKPYKGIRGKGVGQQSLKTPLVELYLQKLQKRILCVFTVLSRPGHFTHPKEQKKNAKKKILRKKKYSDKSV